MLAGGIQCYAVNVYLSEWNRLKKVVSLSENQTPCGFPKDLQKADPLLLVS